MSSTTISPPAPPRRGPGRPPKAKPTLPAAEVIEAPKTDIAVAVPAISSNESQAVAEIKSPRSNYGGKPAFIGATVWYVHTDPTGLAVQAVPAVLFERNPVNPDSWNLSVTTFCGAVPISMFEISFSEPNADGTLRPDQIGTWCWPFVKPAE